MLRIVGLRIWFLFSRIFSPPITVYACCTFLVTALYTDFVAVAVSVNSHVQAYFVEWKNAWVTCFQAFVAGDRELDKVIKVIGSC